MNYAKLMSQTPTYYGKMMNDKGQQIEFFEHPKFGEEHPVICVNHELQLASASEFYETDDMTAEHGEYQPWFDDEGMFHVGRC